MAKASSGRRTRRAKRQDARPVLSPALWSDLAAKFEAVKEPVGLAEPECRAARLLLHFAEAGMLPEGFSYPGIEGMRAELAEYESRGGNLRDWPTRYVPGGNSLRIGPWPDEPKTPGLLPLIWLLWRLAMLDWLTKNYPDAFATGARLSVRHAEIEKYALPLVVEIEADACRLLARILPEVAPKYSPPAHDFGKEAAAVGMKLQHPGWSDKQIAKAVGCNVKSLYRFPIFTGAKARLKAARQDFPKGRKPAVGGQLEAWDE